jgi:hypothetical protein
MTPQEKAAHLILTYMAILVKQDLAKKCALAAADELIRVTPWGGDIDNEIEDGSKEFYMKVKQEIEKL